MVVELLRTALNPFLLSATSGVPGAVEYAIGRKRSNNLCSTPDVLDSESLWRTPVSHSRVMATTPTKTVVLQVSNAERFVAERLSCILRLSNRIGCR